MANAGIYETVLPVIVAPTEVHHGQLKTTIRNIAGTAFPIGGPFFMTAGHVVASAEHQVQLGFPDGSNWISQAVGEVEVLNGVDLALLHAPHIPTASPHPWRLREPSRLEDIATWGYPYGFDAGQLIIYGRAHKGHVVGLRDLHELPASPRGFELSFACPRGLSGAPLVEWAHAPSIRGVVVGNHRTEMLVFSDREQIQDHSSTTIVERYEALNLGVAVEARDIAELTTSLVGTIGEHLGRHGLLLRD